MYVTEIVKRVHTRPYAYSWRTHNNFRMKDAPLKMRDCQKVTSANLLYGCKRNMKMGK